MKRLIALIILIVSAQPSYSQEESELKVKIENIKDVKGSMMIAIYNHEDHFLSKEVMSDGRVIEKNSIEFVFKGLDLGTYAISVYHDQNGNGKLDSNFMGIPSEPYAFSNNAKGMFGPPSFEDCQFQINGELNEIVISL